MGYALLWTVTLAGELLLLATLVACFGRLRRSRIRVTLSVLIVVVQLLAFIGLSIIIQSAKAIQLVPIDFGGPLRYLILCYAIGAGWMISLRWVKGCQVSSCAR